MATKKASGSSSLKKFYLALGAVAVLGAVFLFRAMGGGEATSEPVDLGEIEDQQLLELAQGEVWGDPEAPITIMEFGDYQCPACRHFALQVKPQLDLAYITTGQAKLVYHDFPLEQHPHAFLAARAARCAGDQDRYHDYHDAIFRTQQRWSARRDAAGHFRELASELGLDTGAFRACLESDRHADVVTANRELGVRLRVGGTPTIFVHDGVNPAERLGGIQFLDIQRAMERAAGN